MMADMLGRYPEHLLLIGVQPVDLEDFGGGLHKKTRQQIEPIVDAALEWLDKFGIRAVKREKPLAAAQLLAGKEVNSCEYEENRPTAKKASRIGDDRILNSPHFSIEYKPHPLNPNKTIECYVDHRGKY